MRYELIAQGSALESWQLAQYDAHFQEGEWGELRLQLRTPLTSGQVSWLNQEVRGRGVRLWDDIRQSGSTLYIRAVRGAPWLAIIAAILALVVLALVIRWVLYKAIPEAAEKLESNLYFAMATALPFAVTAFGPEQPKKQKAMLLGALMISGYMYHWVGSRGQLPEMFQEIYDELVGRPPPTDGELPPTDGEPTPTPTTKISDVMFWGQTGILAGSRQVVVVDNSVIVPVVQFRYEGPVRGEDQKLWIRVGIAPSRLPWGHYDVRAWWESRVAIPDPPGDYIVAIGNPYGNVWPPPTEPGKVLPRGDLDAVVVIVEDDPTVPMPIEGPFLLEPRHFFGKWYDPVYRYL